MCTPVQRHAPARDAPWSAPGAVFRPICASPLTPPNATSEINRHAARHAVECYVVYGAKLAARRGGKDPRSPGAAAVACASAVRVSTSLSVSACACRQRTCSGE